MSTNEQTFTRVKNQAYRLLAARNRTFADLRDRLHRRGHTFVTIDLVLRELEAEGYLDDRKYALAWGRYRLEKKPLGRRRLAWELVKRGVSSETIDSVLYELYSEFDEAILAEQAVRKRFSCTEKLQSLVERQRCGRYLMNLGFEADVIATLVEKIASSGLGHGKKM